MIPLIEKHIYLGKQLIKHLNHRIMEIIQILWGEVMNHVYITNFLIHISIC